MKFTSFQQFRSAFFESDDRGLYWRVFLIRTLGNILILGSVAYLFFLFFPVVSAEIAWRSGQLGNKNADVTAVPGAVVTAVSTPEPSSSSSFVTPQPAAILPELKGAPIDTKFGIFVEKIGANARIVSDVNPYSAQEYDAALSQGVGHAKGTAYPGQVGNVYLFAHNTLNAWDIPRYNAVFFLLHNLEAGDRITTFYNDQRYDYIVFDKNIHKPSDLSPLTTKYSEPILSLQTCWPPGTTWQRLVVRAKLVR